MCVRVYVCACVRMCLCKCVRVHTVSFFSKKPDSHGIDTLMMRDGCVCVLCVCVFVRECVFVCVRETEREKEKENEPAARVREREREQERERDRECVCVHFCMHKVTRGTQVKGTKRMKTQLALRVHEDVVVRHERLRLHADAC